MIKKIWPRLMGMALFCIISTVSYAESMQLVYDGKQHRYDLSPITLYINDKKIETQMMPPVQLENRVLVPSREVFEPMGAKVEWKNAEKKVYIDYKNTLLILEVNNKNVWINGNTVSLDVPAKIINDKLVIPVRFISEQMGFEVDWNNDQRTVNIKEEKEQPTLPDNNTPTLPEYDGLIKKYVGQTNHPQINITHQNHPKAVIKYVNIVNNIGQTSAVIQAGSPITYANIMLQEGKVIIDLQNSKSGLNSSITPEYNTYVKGIRTSQFTEDTTRVVLDLKSGANVIARMSEDRLNLMIELVPQNMEGMGVGQDVQGEYLVLNGIANSQIKITEVPLANQVAFEIENAKIKDEVIWDGFTGNYIDSVNIRNTSKGISGTIQIKQGAEYACKLDYKTGQTFIRIIDAKVMNPYFGNLNYRQGMTPVLELMNIPGLMADRIKIDDRYRERKIVIDLGADYSAYLEQGKLKPQDGKINEIAVTTSGTTKITIQEQNIYALNINKQSGKIEIQFVKPRDKYQQIVVLDPGHGGSAPGASASGLVEKNINLKHAMAVYQRLEQNPNIKVYITRVTDADVPNQSRADLANLVGADVFVSMHNNSVGKTDINGTELLYAAKYTDERSAKSKKMAEIVLNSIDNYTNIGIRRTIPRPDLLVLNQTQMPAILIETGYMTSPKDAGLINSPKFIEDIGNAVYIGIVEIFDTMSFR